MNESTLHYDSLFLDSGAHSLWEKHVGTRGNTAGYAFYDSPKFWDYVDQYAEFIKQNPKTIDYYASVDVIFDPVRTWKVQQYLEKEHGLKPVPAVHYGTDVKWLKHYLDRGYEFIGFGGIGQGLTVSMYKGWADRMFAYLCPSPSYLPKVRVHGYAMTAYDLMWRYPFYSVDSSSWTKCGAFGGILVPHRKAGQFHFDVNPYVMKISDKNSSKCQDAHFRTLSEMAKEVLLQWLVEIGVPLGNEQTEGVINNHSQRKLANLYFFERMRKALPEYPWPFKPKESRKQVLPC